MNPKDLAHQAQQDPVLAPALESLAKELEQQGHAPPGQYGVTGLEPLFAMAAYALYRIIRDALDHHRSLDNLKILERQIDIVAQLKNAGFSEEAARTTVVELAKAMQGKSADDPLIQAAVKLASGGAGGA